MRLIGERCAISFLSDRVHDNRTGGDKSPKKSHWQCMGQILAGRSSEREFLRNLWITTLEEAIKLCENIPRNGVKVAPLGGRSAPKLPHWLTMVRDGPWNGPSYIIETAFQLNITLDHSVIETRGQAHLSQTTNQHLRIIVKLSSHAPSNHLEHLSNTSHRLPLKEIKGISQDRSVIETWGWARLTRGSKQPILNHLNTHWPRPSNHCRAP